MAPCAACNDLVLNTFGSYANREIPLPDLFQGIENGCEACIVLRDGVLTHCENFDGAEKLVLWSLRKGGSLSVNLWGPQGVLRQLEFYTHPDAPSCYSVLGSARDVSVDSSASETFELARTWIHDCQLNHECGSKMGPLPTRVLQLNRDDERVFLYEPKERVKKNYVALSHCWGDIMLITTVLGNCDGHKTDGILISELPKSFQDAVLITKRLSVDYLWIDSLCIIQDSTADWEQEAAQMDRVYAASYFTIAAHGALDSRGGCFISGNDRLCNSSSVPCPGPEPEQTEVYVRYQAFRQPYNGDGLPHVAEVNETAKPSRLTTRGWVFQERLLSRRTLHYTPTELVFECDSGLQCECLFEEIETEKEAENFKKRYIKARLVHFNLDSVRQWSNPEDQIKFSLQKRDDIRERRPRLDLDWPELVEAFTKLNFTFEKDRLPALSGLAAAKQRGTAMPSSKDEYLFGLWSVDIIGGLLWQSGRKISGTAQTVNRRQPDAFSPTWSWASVTGPIYYKENIKVEDPGDFKKRQRYSHRFKILDVTATPSTRNPFGPGSGSITVLCSLVTVKIIHVEPRETFSHMSFVAASTKALESGTCPYGYFNPDIKGDGYEISDGDVCYFIIVTWTGRQTYQGKGGSPIGLILKRTEDGKFKRAGYLEDSKARLDEWEDVSEPAIVTII